MDLSMACLNVSFKTCFQVGYEMICLGELIFFYYLINGDFPCELNSIFLRF